MKILMSWLRELVDFDLSASELASGLTMQGTEAESVRSFADFFTDDSLLAEVLSKPIEIDETTVKYEVYADGASAIAVSRARHIPAGFRVLARKVEGAEATLGDAHSGGKGKARFVIPTLAELGLNQLRFPLVIPALLTIEQVKADSVVEFETLSNRGDLLSHIGMAREVSILTGNVWREPALFTEHGTTDEKAARPIRLDAPDLCPRYIGMTFADVEIAESPDWIWYRLCALGFTPISNIVDLTNYVLLELGQPLHAFDSDRLDGSIIVRRAADGEKFAAINHNEYALTTQNLMIADEARSVAIGGVMGGLESEISDETKTLFLESAYFTPINIRKSSKRLGLMSDSGLRFGRGVDPEGTARGARRFAYLLRELGCGKFVQGSFRDADVRRGVKTSITFPIEKTRSVLGIDIKDERINDILISSGFAVAGRPPVVQVSPPSWRGDFEIPEDIVEEVLRIYSYTKLKPSMPILPLGMGRFDDTFRWDTRMRDAMRAMALQEVRTYTLVNPSVIRKWFNRPSPDEGTGYESVLPECIFLANPDTADMSCLRATTGSGLVDVLALNRRKHSEPVPVLYEVGRIYHKAAPKEGEQYAYTISYGDAHYTETRTLGMLVAVDMTLPSFAGESFASVSPLYAAKAIVGRLVAELGFSCEFNESGDSVSAWFERGYAVDVLANDFFIGEIGILRSELDPLEGARGAIAFAEISIDAIRSLPKPEVRIESPSQYPSINRDLAFIVPLTLPAGELAKSIRELGGDALADVSIFDQFVGKKLAPREIKGTLTPIKNLAFSLRFQLPERTLTNDEVDSAIFAILSGCFDRHCATLRDYEHVKSDAVLGDTELWTKLLAKY